MRNNHLKIIDPNALYTPTSLAEIFQVDDSWVKKNLIYPREIRYKKQGAVYIILGQWVIDWAQRSHDQPDDDEGWLTITRQARFWVCLFFCNILQTTLNLNPLPNTNQCQSVTIWDCSVPECDWPNFSQNPSYNLNATRVLSWLQPTLRALSRLRGLSIKLKSINIL